MSTNAGGVAGTYLPADDARVRAQWMPVGYLPFALVPVRSEACVVSALVDTVGGFVFSIPRLGWHFDKDWSVRDTCGLIG